MSQQDEPTQRPLRVIVVGAGLVGLSLSHALQLANVDHIVLEKHEKIVSLHGAALIIYPGVARIFDQFGILQNIHAATTPVQSEYTHWPDGTIYSHDNMLDVLYKKFETPPVLFDRQSCVEHLYAGLPDKSRIRTSARVQRIEHTPTSVKVHLTDGTFEEGDLVIGADGVHSVVRQSMWDYAAEHEPNTIPESDKKAMYTQFKGIFGVSDQGDLPDMGPADVHVILGQDVTKLLFTSLGNAYWAVVYRDEYSQPPKAYRPDAKEKDEVAERFKNVKMAERLTFGDLYEKKTRSGVLNIEEGILDKWHAGRIVLVGDSAHKMTADLAMGANTAIESAITLCNLLHHAVTSPSPQSHLSQPLSPQSLTSLFTQYQTTRHPRAQSFVQLSGEVTRMRTYETPWKKLFISHIAPWLENVQVKQFAASLKETPKLDYVDVRTINEGAVGWKGEEKAGGDTRWSWWMASAVMAVGVGVAYVVGARRL